MSVSRREKPAVIIQELNRFLCLCGPFIYSLLLNHNLLDVLITYIYSLIHKIVCVSDLLRVIVTEGNGSLFTWLMKIIKHEKLLIEQSGQLLFFACFSGSIEMLKQVMHLLESFDFLKQEMELTYDEYDHILDTSEKISINFENLSELKPGSQMFNEAAMPVNCFEDNETSEFQFLKGGAAAEQHTLLTLLCSRNSDTDFVQILLERGFPHDRVSHRFKEKTALDWSRIYCNSELESLIIEWTDS